MRRLLYLSTLLVCFAQTRVGEQQISFNIRVVERFICTQPPAPVDCSSIALYRFQLADGSITGHYYVIPAPADFVMDDRWVKQ